MAISKVTLNGTTQMDVTDTTATVNDVVNKYFYGADGVKYLGTASGGGITPAEEDDVIFIDYDGTILYSYSAAEFANLSAFPANPSHDRLTAQGWNWSLAGAKSYVATHGELVIGQMYIPTSGGTELDVYIRPGMLSPYLNFGITGAADIDWGDNSTHSTVTGSSSTVQHVQHTYASPGHYTIVITVSNGGYSNPSLSPGDGSGKYNFLGTNVQWDSKRSNVYSSMIERIRVGPHLHPHPYSFQGCYNMTSITLPWVADDPLEYFTGLGNTPITGCVIPYPYVQSLDECFYGNPSMRYISLPEELWWPPGLNYCTALRRININNGLTGGLPTSVAANNYALFSFTIPRNETGVASNNCKIPNSAFSECMSLYKLVIPSWILTIEAQAFQYCGLKELHFLGTTPPTVSNSNAFQNLPTDCTIYVPTGYLSAYTGATNYPSSSTYNYVEE